MVPIPADPLALPFTLKSDPLRGPIYVPLNEEPLLRSKSALFEGIYSDITVLDVSYTLNEDAHSELVLGELYDTLFNQIPHN